MDESTPTPCVEAAFPVLVEDEDFFFFEPPAVSSGKLMRANTLALLFTSAAVAAELDFDSVRDGFTEVSNLARAPAEVESAAADFLSADSERWWRCFSE